MQSPFKPKATNEKISIEGSSSAVVAINLDNHQDLTWNEKLRMWGNVDGKIDATMVILHEKKERLRYSDYYGFVNSMTVAHTKYSESVELKAQKYANNLTNRYMEDKLYQVPFCTCLGDKLWPYREVR
ncbi:hypothetical protein ACFE04_020767 [Oxalis oulophora]